jgi:hypothetical protein
MTAAEQWNWVVLAYGFAEVALVTYVVSIALRIRRSKRRLGDQA